MQLTSSGDVDRFEVLDDAVAEFGRFFRCPRCGGEGLDPEQPELGFTVQDPPDPCGLCNGYGTYGPRGHVAPWDFPNGVPEDFLIGVKPLEDT